MNSLNLIKLYNYFLPSDYNYLGIRNDIKRIYLVSAKSRLRVIDELRIHTEVLKSKQIEIKEIEILISKLIINKDEFINILCGSTSEYVFEMFITDDLSSLIGFILNKKRVKNEQEIMWEKSLGIDPP